jgi:hypothetical protein
VIGPRRVTAAERRAKLVTAASRWHGRPPGPRERGRTEAAILDEDEATSLTAWLAGATVTARYRTPLERQLART